MNDTQQTPEVKEKEDIAEEKGEPKKIDVSNLEWKQILELDACVRCGECVVWCPVYVFDQKEDITPRAKIRKFRQILKSQNSLIRKFIDPGSLLGRLICPKPVSEEEIIAFAEDLYECSTCRQCHFVCPAGIDTVELYEAIRRSIVNAGYGPLKNHMGLVTSTKSYDNPWQQPRTQRARWTRAAKKAGRIKEEPIMLKPSKEAKKK